MGLARNLPRAAGVLEITWRTIGELIAGGAHFGYGVVGRTTLVKFV